MSDDMKGIGDLLAKVSELMTRGADHVPDHPAHRFFLKGDAVALALDKNEWANSDHMDRAIEVMPRNWTRMVDAGDGPLACHSQLCKDLRAMVAAGDLTLSNGKWYCLKAAPGAPPNKDLS